MLIYFARHGQTEENYHGIIQGTLDTQLNEHGRREARCLGEYLKHVPFTEAWSSSLQRAMETAQIVLAHHPGMVLRTDPGLMERGLGNMQGKRRLRNEKPKGVEPGDIFRQRIANWFASFLLAPHPIPPPSRDRHRMDLLSSSGHHDRDPSSEPTVLVVSHGAYLTALLSVLLVRSPVWSFHPTADVHFSSQCVNTSLTIVYVEPVQRRGKWRGEVRRWADVSHLRELRDPREWRERERGEERGKVPEVADDVPV